MFSRGWTPMTLLYNIVLELTIKLLAWFWRYLLEHFFSHLCVRMRRFFDIYLSHVYICARLILQSARPGGAWCLRAGSRFTQEGENNSAEQQTAERGGLCSSERRICAYCERWQLYDAGWKANSSNRRRCRHSHSSVCVCVCVCVCVQPQTACLLVCCPSNKFCAVVFPLIQLLEQSNILTSTHTHTHAHTQIGLVMHLRCILVKVATTGPICNIIWSHTGSTADTHTFTFKDKTVRRALSNTHIDSNTHTHTHTHTLTDSTHLHKLCVCWSRPIDPRFGATELRIQCW